MKIENVKYVPCSQDELWEKVDEIARYLRLTAEFGCADSGKKIFNEFENELTKLISQFQKLVLQQKDPDEPDDIEEIRMLDKLPSGFRTNGVGASTYNLGNFSIDDYGKCKLYIYFENQNCISIKLKDNSYIFFNDKSNDETLRYYEELEKVLIK